MENTKFKMSVYLLDLPEYRSKRYLSIRDLIRYMKPSDVRPEFWLSNSMRNLIDHDRIIELEGTVEQFLELMKCRVKIQGLFILSENLFVM